MALLPFADSLDAIPEPLRAHYVEREGRYVLDVTPAEGWALEDVAGLKRTLEDRKGREKEARDRLARFEGLDPDEARAAIARPAGKDSEESRTKLRAELEEKHQRERQLLEARAANFEGQLKSKLIDAEAARLLASEGLRGSYELLIGPIRNRVQAEVGDDGAITVRVLEADKSTQMYATRGSKVEPASIEDLVRSMKSDAQFMRAFDGSGATGGGAGGAGRPNGNGHNKSDLSGLSPEARLEAAFAGGTSARS